MDAVQFEAYLEREGKNLRDRQCILARAKRVELAMGNLDEAYKKDRCAEIIKQLTYLRKDFKAGVPQAHPIDINGNVYTGTLCLRRAIELFVQFKNETGDETADGFRMREKLLAKELFSVWTGIPKADIFSGKIGTSRWDTGLFSEVEYSAAPFQDGDVDRLFTVRTTAQIPKGEVCSRIDISFAFWDSWGLICQFEMRGDKEFLDRLSAITSKFGKCRRDELVCECERTEDALVVKIGLTEYDDFDFHRAKSFVECITHSAYGFYASF